MRQAAILIFATVLLLMGAACAGQDPDTAQEVEASEPAAEPPAEAAVADSGDSPIPIPIREVGAEAEVVMETAEEAVTETVAEVAARAEGPVAVPGATRIGAAKCKICHKIQYDSWAESGHAGLDPVLDCESCHGPGSLYKKKSVMENRELAVAAGLALPGAEFCSSCHTDDWDDGMLQAAHEHKQAS